MNDNHPLNRLLIEAAQYSPFEEASDFGFETRLRASLKESSLSTTDWVAKFSWRFSAACFPVLIAVAVFLTMQHHQVLPEGVGGIVTHWMEFLPLGI